MASQGLSMEYNCVSYSKSDILLYTLLDFFRDQNNFTLFSSIVNKDTKISLRVLDWLVTNYSKKNNCIIERFEGNALTTFNIYIEYKNQLRAYSKSNFDPFCRKNRIILNSHTINIEKDIINDKCFYTTVGQMNFFRWIIKNNIINYLILNIEKIETDMLFIANDSKRKHNSKRCCLSENNSKKLNFYNTNITIKF